VNDQTDRQTRIRAPVWLRPFESLWAGYWWPWGLLVVGLVGQGPGRRSREFADEKAGGREETVKTHHFGVRTGANTYLNQGLAVPHVLPSFCAIPSGMPQIERVWSL
jgi:hypothetical protein